MQNGVTITDIFSGTHALPGGHLPIRSMPELEFQPYQVEGRKGVSVFTLYNDRETAAEGPSAALVRYAPGAVTPRHFHPGWELVLVLDGELIDDRGRHGAGVLQTYPPGSTHELSSEIGCTFLVVWEKPVRPASQGTCN